jgi:single-strand DNA-binding protein
LFIEEVGNILIFRKELEMELKTFGAGVATADSEFRQVGENGSLCTVNLAFNRNYMNGKKEWTQEVAYIKANVWGKRAEKFNELVKKGTLVYVEGFIKQESWTDKQEQKHTVLTLNVTNFEICQKTNTENSAKPVAKSAKTNAPAAAASPPQNQKAKAKKPVPVAVPVVEDDDDDDDDCTVEANDDEVPF